MRGIGHRRNGLDGVTDSVVPVPNLINLRRGQLLLLVNSLGQPHDDPRKRQPKHHFNGKAIGGAIEVEKQEAVNCFAKTQGSENHCHPNQAQGQPVDWTKLRRLLIANVLHDCRYLTEGEMLHFAIVLQVSASVQRFRAAEARIGAQEAGTGLESRLWPHWRNGVASPVAVTSACDPEDASKPAAHSPPVYPQASRAALRT